MKFINLQAGRRMFLVVFAFFLLEVSPLVPVLLSSASADSTSSSTLIPGFVLNREAPENLPVLVNIGVPLRNLGLLSSLVAQVSDPSSPIFRNFLTTTEVRQDFLPTVAYNLLLTDLKSAGLPVVMTALDSIIVVQATVGQVKEVFHADVYVYSNGTSSYYTTGDAGMFEGARFTASNATGLMVKPRISSSALPKTYENVTFTEGAFSAKQLQAVYNATGLYAQGFLGAGQTIGLLDFFGSPTITQDLSLFDQQYGFPDANLTITPIVPYDPNLGVSEGWSSEVALDVEVSHAMAPQASLNMYVTNGALTFAADLAPIVQANSVTTLGQSFAFNPEYAYSVMGADSFYFDMFLPDQYCMLGAVQGITFLSASGDAGGSGYSSGPAGNLGYPDDSPYVTTAGGTQTYISNALNGTENFVQTAWSNPVYVPNGTNTGGSGGGVSFLEPKPWYQQNQPTPASYPNGRMEPDLSLQAGGDPGVYIIDGGQTIVVGGTSESVQLLSGLLTLTAQSAGGRLGLINPFLYSLGNNPNLYTKAFTAITFGYTIPWTAATGYNLATGWGAPNIGEIAQIYNTQKKQANLTIQVTALNSAGQEQQQFTPGQTALVTANITGGGAPATNGSFTASITTLVGTFLNTPMQYNSKSQVWTANLTMGQESGVAYLNVNGTSQSLVGSGFTEIFAGYLASFLYPVPTAPMTTLGSGISVVISSTDLMGNSAPMQTVTLQVSSYSILRNAYATVDTMPLKSSFDPSYGTLNSATLTANYPTGPLLLMLEGNIYGFLPLVNGIYLQNTVIIPELAVEPGSVAPGQSLIIITSPIAPLNVGGTVSKETRSTVGSDVSTGANVTAQLVNPLGTTVAASSLYAQFGDIVGGLTVPQNAFAGLYTILIVANYSSASLGYTLNGSFFAQVQVSNGVVTPVITFSPPALYMGQTVLLTADIRYPQGSEVTLGEYTALIYPQELANDYNSIMFAEAQTGDLTMLSYDPVLDRWTANITLPSPYNAAALSPVTNNVFDYSGPYEAYVSGISSDGVPTTSAVSAQQGFYIQPYVVLSNQTVSRLQQTQGLALTGDTLTANADLAKDVFMGANWLKSSSFTITDSTLNGTLYAVNSTLTVVDLQGGNITAQDSTITLVNSNINTLALTNSNVTLTASTFQTVIPPAPTVQILSPVAGGSYIGDLSGSAIVTGKGISSTAIALNGQTVQTIPNANGTLTFTLPTGKYPDGTYTLQVTAQQTDGLSATANSTIVFQNQMIAQTANLTSQLNSQVGSLQNILNKTQTALQNQISSLQSSLQNSQNRTNLYAYTGIAIGTAAVVIASVTTVNKQRKKTISVA